MMRISPRSLATTLLAVGVASCSDSPLAAVKQGTGPARAGFARIGFAPVFSRSAAYVADHADQFGIEFDSVRVVIRDTPDTSRIVADTTVFFNASSAALTLNLQVQAEVDGQRFDALMQYLGPAGQVVYSGHSIVQSYPVGGTPPAQTPITINFVGPGSRAAKIVVSPKTATLLDGQTAPFTVIATDSSGAATAAPPIAWTTSDSSAAHISSTGVLTTAGRRAAVIVTATSPTGLSDNAAVNITLPPVSIAVVSGGGQSGTVGSALADPAVVQVSASDGVGVAGVNVVFSAPAGGSVGTTSATTDGSGRASATLRLGNAAGPQAFAATAAGFSVGIPVTAFAGDPAAIAAVSGGGQTGTILHALPQPLIVHVSDRFGNAVAGATVNWTRVGTGLLSAPASSTNAEGNASVTYILGTIAGKETISASVSGVSTAVSFAVTAILPTGTPAALVWKVPPTNAIANVAITPAIQVAIVDAAGNVTASTGAVTLAFNGGSPNGARLAGTLTRNAVGGIATFNDITISGVATGVGLTASSGSLPVVNSTTFSVLPQAVAQITTPLGNTIVNTVNATSVAYPSFKLVDANNNAVPNQNVSVSVSGACTINGASSRTSDASGQITFDSGYLTIPTANPTSCRLTATNISNETMFASIYLIVAPSIGVAWTGSVSTDWGNAANWSPSVAPTNLTPVYVPQYTRSSPMLSADQAVDNILVDDGATLNLGGHTLTSSGTVDAHSSGAIQNGKLALLGNGTAANLVRGVLLPTTTCSGGAQYQLSSSVHFSGSLTLNSCALAFNGNLALVDSNFTTAGASMLSMSSSSDILYVKGNANFAGSNMTLTNGNVVVFGNFTQTGSAASFNATANNSVYLAGTSPATISFATTTNAHFNNLYIVNTASDGAHAETDSVHVATPIVVDDTLGVFSVLPLPLPLTIDTSVVTVNSLQLGPGNGLVLGPRSQLTATTCKLFTDGTNPSSVSTLLGGLLRFVSNQVGNSQGSCTQPTGAPSVAVPGTSTVSALTSASAAALRRPRTVGILR